MTTHNSITEQTREHLAQNFKNTELGLVRVARHLCLQSMSDDEIVGHCRKIILATPISEIIVRGKNYYLTCREFSAVLTINRSSLGIITAKPCT